MRFETPQVTNYAMGPNISGLMLLNRFIFCFICMARVLEGRGSGWDEIGKHNRNLHLGIAPSKPADMYTCVGPRGEIDSHTSPRINTERGLPEDSHESGAYLVLTTDAVERYKKREPNKDRPACIRCETEPSDGHYIRMTPELDKYIW